MESVWVHGFFLFAFFLFSRSLTKEQLSLCQSDCTSVSRGRICETWKESGEITLVILVNFTHIPLDVLYFVKFEMFTKKQSHFREMFSTLVSLSKASLNPFNIFEK